MNLVHLLTEPVAGPELVRALVTASVAAAVCALLSCWLVLTGWSLMGDAVSHAVLPGVVLAYLFGAPFALGALVFGFLAVLLVGVVRDTSRVKEDAAIGIVFTTLFAFGLVLISVTPAQADLDGIIFGDLFGVTTAEFVQILVIAMLAFALLLLKHRDLTLYAFDRTYAYATGLNPKLLGALLLGVLALTTVVALQVVGVVLVVAMLIIPGATAHLLTDRFGRMLLIAPTIAVASAIIGVLFAAHFGAEAGGAIVVTQGIVFTIAYLFSPTHGLLAKRRARIRRRATLVAGGAHA